MSILSLPRGVLIGAVTMYFADPVRGRARRARVRDAGTHAQKVIAELLNDAIADAKHRAEGRKHHPRQTDNERVIRERIKSQLGHVVSYPSVIEVVVGYGADHVILRGPILADEAALAIAKARSASGITNIVDELERHATRDIPALQGEVHEPPKDRWPASMRGLALIGGTGLAFIGLVRGGVKGTLQIAVGLTLAGRAAFDLPVGQVPRRAIEHLGAMLRETPGGMFPGHPERHRDEPVREASVVG